MKSFRQAGKPNLRPKKSTLVVGPEAVLAALQSGQALDKIYLHQTASGPAYEQVRVQATNAGVPIQRVPIEKIDHFHVQDHYGCVAVKSKVQYYKVQDVIDQVLERGETPFFLMLDGITDIRNIGGIARSAYAMGVHAIIIPDKGVGALNEDAFLTSAGALEHLLVCRVNSLMKTVDELHLNGIPVYASVMQGEKHITEIPFNEPCCIVMGGEEKGIYPALQKICDAAFRIPMPGDFESLNVSVATGIILYEVVRQRNPPNL